MTNKQAPVASKGFNRLDHRINHVLLFTYVQSQYLSAEQFTDNVMSQLNKIYGVYGKC